MPPLLLDDDEAVAVAVGLRSAASGTVVDLGEASLRALTKLEQASAGRPRGMVAALQGATVPLAAAGATVEPEVLVTIARPAGRASGCAFDTGTAAADRVRDAWSPTGWSRRGTGGTCSPAISIKRSGAPSAWTA